MPVFHLRPKQADHPGIQIRRKAMSEDIAPTIETHKNSARRLRKLCRTGDADALSRVTAHIPKHKNLKHADFLHVIAREAGHDSWPKLKFAIEAANMTRAEQAERLKVALYFGQHWVSEKLLAADPTLKNANLGLQIALYDLGAVRSVVEGDASAATQLIGIRSPILHLAFSQELHRNPDKVMDMLAIAELLVVHGADVDEGYPAEPGADHKLSALYGALCHADNFALGKLLLEKGADPNDNETLYHSTELGDARALALLLQHGAKPDGTNALPRALDFENREMVRLLLEAGADPNVTVPDHPSGMPMNTIPSLHQAVRRGRSNEIVELLLKFGANPHGVWMGHSAYATALIYGNRAAAEYLKKFTQVGPLSENEKVLASVMGGNAKPGQLDVTSLEVEDRSLLASVASEPGNLDRLKALVAAGLDPETADNSGMTPLHMAAWNGLVPELSYFLSFNPDLTRKNGYGGDALDTVVHGSEFAPRRDETDHITCARLLLEAGSFLDPRFIANCGNEDLAQFLEDWQSSSH
jgi:ankyrin repeat protein